jgi:hypothetical protein
MVGVKMRTDLAIYEELDSDIQALKQLFSVEKTLQLPDNIPPAERRAESNQFFDSLNPISRQKWKNPHLSESQVKKFKEDATRVLVQNRKAIGERAEEIRKKQMEELHKLLQEGQKINGNQQRREHWVNSIHYIQLCLL